MKPIAQQLKVSNYIWIAGISTLREIIDGGIKLSSSVRISNDMGIAKFISCVAKNDNDVSRFYFKEVIEWREDRS